MRLRKLPLRLAYSAIVSTACGRSVVFHPPEQSLRTVKGEDVAAARHGIETVGEARFRAGGLVAERQRRAPGGNTEGYASSHTSRTALRRRSANGRPVWPQSCRSLCRRQRACSPARRVLKESSRTATPRDAARFTALLSCTAQPHGPSSASISCRASCSGSGIC